MTKESFQRFDIPLVREKLAHTRGQKLWQSLDELAETPEYLKFLQSEFPGGVGKQSVVRPQDIGRRDVLKLMAASAALCGLTGCTKLPPQKILPYVSAPEEIVPGRPLFYATSMPQGHSAMGLLIETHSGRPTKIEGNPQHPASQGPTNIFAQASVLTFWDPDRSHVVLRQGQISAWPAFLAAMRSLHAVLNGTRGKGVRILTGAVCSPTLGSQIQSFLSQFPEARWYVHEPFGEFNAKAGAQAAFGRSVNTVYRFDRADVVFSLDSDFISRGPTAVRYARDFMNRRSVDTPSGTMNRLYVVEPALTNTGAMADHRLPMRCASVSQFARALAAAIGISAQPAAPPVPNDWFTPLVRDLQAHRGSSLIVPGDSQPGWVHGLAHSMNQALDSVGNTLYYTEPTDFGDAADALPELVQEIETGQVSILILLDTNPVFSAPSDLEFDRHLQRVPLRIHVGLYDDETAQLCHWHIPQAHFLESWSDARTFDGTVGIVQPVTEPIYHGHSVHEVLTAITGGENASDYERVRSYWREQRGFATAKQFEDFWETTLHDGIMAGTAYSPLALTPRAESTAPISAGQQTQSEGLELIFRPDPTIGDGTWSNNAWLQELPKPITTLTWDNALMLSPATAWRLGVSNEDLVEISNGESKVVGPVWIMPGHADDCATISCGYGRWRVGPVGNGLGFNGYSVRTSSDLWTAQGATISKTGAVYPLARTQAHHPIERPEQPGPWSELQSQHAFERELVRVATIEEFRRNPLFAKDHDPAPTNRHSASLVEPYAYPGYAWGMSIDLNRCIGCSACVVACYAENNIPTVGKQEVMAGRDMQWIRVDTYFRGGLDNPETFFEPLPCMHCENAPCELVCPVGATVHSSDGLNEMIYNRCVGTRYCSNNCPYKVRRFNFKLYSDWSTPSLYGLRNPDVTVRSRGVMEKCTYCVQRIHAAQIEAKKEDRPIRNGEILTACQQVCPTDAIVFGNINDPNSKAARRKADARDYALLAELNVRPRTTYGAKLTNPNPDIPVAYRHEAAEEPA